MNKRGFWKVPENAARLRELAGLRLTARQIADAMGKTRNAVLGICHRDGVALSFIQGTEAKFKSRPERRGKPRMPAHLKAAPRTQPSPISDPCPPRAIGDLGDKMCRWPISDFPVFMFCAMPEHQKGYCEWHWHVRRFGSAVKQEESAA